MIQAWSPFVVFGLFILWIVIVTARLSVHTQKHLASFNEKDWLVDAFVWINRYTSRRPRCRRSRAVRSGKIWCGREDSNFHEVAPTSTSSLRVYHSATTAPW